MDISQVKKNLNKIVVCDINGNQIKYKFTACILRMDSKTSDFIYHAELRDTKANFSVIITKLENVRSNYDS